MLAQGSINWRHSLSGGLALLLLAVLFGVFILCLYVATPISHHVQGMDHSPQTHLAHLSELSTAVLVSLGSLTAVLAIAGVFLLFAQTRLKELLNLEAPPFYRNGWTAGAPPHPRHQELFWLFRFERSPELIRAA